MPSSYPSRTTGLFVFSGLIALFIIGCLLIWPSENTPVVQAATNIPDGTVISTDTTWDNSGDATFILEGSVTVNPGVTLTIEEGVQVLADVEDAVINVEGTLDAQGSSANPITMDIDPNAGIDSWIGLRFATTDATAPVGSMTFVEILNTGAPDTDDFSAAIAADNASTIAITNSTIMTVTRTTAGNSYGVFADQSSTITLDTVTIEAVLGNTTTPDPDDDGRGIAGQSTSTFNLTDVTIEDTNYPIYEEDGSTTDDTLTFAIDNVDIISATVLGHFMPDTLAMFFNDLGSDDDFGCTPTTTDSCFEQISDASVEIREGILSMDTRWISTDDLTDYYLLDPDGSSPSNAVVAVSPDTTLTISPTTAMTISVADSRALHIGQPESIQSNTGIGAEDSRLIIDNPNAFDLVMTSISGRWAGIFFGPRASGDLEYLTILNTGKRNIAPISPGDGGTRAAIAVYQATVDIRSTLILTPTTGGDSVPSDADGAIGLYVNDGIVTLSDDSRIQDVNGEDPPIEDNGILAEGDSAYVTVIDTVITASQDSNILARDGATVKLINSESSQSEEAHGLLLRNGSTAIINCSAILSNTNGSTGSGILIANLSSLQEDPTLVVRGSQISGNDFGLAVDETTVSTAATVDVIENWWGAADGPGAPDGPGSGDPLSDDAGIADFDPFATDIADLVCSSDITFIKTAALDEVDAGGTLTYTLTVDNPTPIDSDSVTISDTVPVSTTLVSFAPDPASCTFADNVLSCDIGSVPAESTEAITMVVQVDSTADSTAPGTIDNTGEAIISNDLTPADNIDSVSTAIIQRADLEVAKEVSSPIIQGNSITYTLTITNNGPALASGVILTDTLPVSVTYDSDTGGCTEDSGEVTCAIGSLDVNISTTLDILVVVDTDVAVGDTFTNTVEVSGSTTDPDTTNNTAETPATVGTGADMEVTKSVDPSAEVKAGNTITYTIIATNNGPQSTGGVVFTDTLPVSVTTPITIETSSNVSCSRTDEEVVCSQSTDFDADDTEIVTITVSTDTDLTGTLTNTVEISADEDDPDSSNNSDEVAIEAVIEPELSLSKVTDPITATQNEVLTYTITITNEGPSVARSVIVTDTLPDDVDLQEFSPTSDCSESSSAITCDFGTLDPDDVETVTVIVTPTLAGIITNTAELDSIDTDVISESVETTVQSLADLQIDKAVSEDPLRQGATFTYTLTITNTGPSDASVVTMTDTLPNSITIESIDPGSFDCDQGTARITCTLTTLAADEVDTIVIVATPLESGINITNTATITSTSIDESTDDNTDSVTSEVIAEGDLEISKVADVTEATAGLPLTYTITITNNGPSDITGVALSDTLPTTVTFVSITDTQSICTQGPPINCSFGDLDADATEVITLVVTPNVSGTLQNTAIVTTTDTDPDTTNNTSSATLPVRARADLSISKTAPAELIAGQTIGYTIEVINNGPSTATGVQVIDQVPDGLTIIPGFDVRCGINGSLITCNLDDMIFLETESIQFQAVVASDLVDPAEETVDLINSASVSANEPDDDTTNNDSGPQTTTVRAETDLSVTKVGAPDPVVAGESLDFTITVVNNGPSTATGVSVSDTLPDNVTLDTASAECSGTAPIVCDAGTLAPGENQPFTISVLVDPTTAETVVNQITVSGDQTDPNPDNNTFSSNTSVTVESNVSVTKVADVTTLRLGDEIQYTITIENAGPSAVLNGVLTDPLPSGLVFVLASSGCSNANNTVTCNIDTILPNESASIVITARFSPESGIDTLESLNNVATFTSNIGAILGQGNVLVEVEAIPGNNYLPLIMWQAPKFADLVGSLRLTPAETSFTAGELVQITAVVTNQGEAPASGFWVDLYINPSTPPTTASIITTTLWQNLCTLEPCFGLVWGVTQTIDPGESVELTTEPITYEELFSAWPTPGWFANGTNSLYLYVDSWNPGVVGGAIEESNENNNRSEITGLTVTGENPPFALLSQLNQWPQRGRTP